MTVFEWPDVVGEEATSIPAHAANLKVDVANLHRLIHQGAESVPSEIFLQFSLSIQALLDKVLDQPDLDDIRRTIDRIDENTATILDRVSSSHGKDRPDDQQLAEAGFPQSENDEMTSKFASTPGASQSTAYHVVEPGDSSSLVIRSNLTAEGNVHGQIYSPLDKTKNEIRVVAISPSIDSVFDISCDLSVVSLDEKPVYRALSYTWGDAKDTLPIRLNGHRFDVTRNLKQALQRLRSLGTDSTIWIDAICINQIDMEERMHQVQLMRCIYESPIEVLVYLGEPHGSYPTVQATMQDDNAWDHSLFSWTGDKSDVARINAILEYGQAYADTYPNAPDARTPDTLMLGICFLRLVAGDVHLTDIPLVANVNIRNLITSAMQMLTSMPWWNRIWVVQEVILPPAVKVLYGRFSLPLQMLSNASVHLEKHRTSCCKGILTVEKYQIDCFNALERKMSTIDQSSKLWREHARTTLMTILQLYYTKDATDPRDKVYGLLGLVRDWGNLEPTTPDYAISVGQLYEEVALQSIMISGTLDFLSYRAEKILQQAQYFEDLETMKRAILYHTDIPRDADDNLRWDKEDAMNQGEPETVEFSYSSWATDWAAMTELGYEVIVAERISRLPLFNACGGRPATPPPQLFTSSRVLRRTAVLKVSAFRVGKVEFESENGADYSMPLLLHNDATFPTDETLPLPLRPKKAHKATYPNGSTRYEAICRAICGDTFYIESTYTSTQANESNFRRATPYDIASIALWRAWLHKSKSIHITQHIPPSAQDFSTEEEFTRVRDADRAIRSMGLLRRFIELDSGYVGMASHARPNDEVMVFMGAKTPFAVRKVGGVEVEGVGVKCVWVVIGECYVPGVMDGEFVEKMEEEGNVPEAIYLI